MDNKYTREEAASLALAWTHGDFYKVVFEPYLGERKLQVHEMADKALLAGNRAAFEEHSGRRKELENLEQQVLYWLNFDEFDGK